mgnify:CR=1 FL=1
MCMYCKCKEFFNSTTMHVVNYKNGLIIIKNVPCIECEQCGEKFYSDEVAQILDKIIGSVKKFSQEISIIDYKKAA